MSQITMYPGQVNSPAAELAENINASQTTIPIDAASILPDAPNICTISIGEDAETILYLGKNGNNLIDVTRGFEGPAKSWNAGTKVRRLFTAYDYDSLRQNHESHLADKSTHIVPSVRVTNTANQSLAHATNTALSFNQVTYDNDGMYSSANPNRLTAKTKGKYLVTGNARFDASTAGIRFLQINHSRYGTLALQAVNASIDGGTNITISTVIDMNENEFVTLIGYQTSGATLNVTATGNSSPIFGMIRVGD